MGMRKRIGSKLYDTGTSELVKDVGVGVLYRKRTRDREWFLVIGGTIEPLNEDQARALLGEDVRVQAAPDNRIMIAIDRETHMKISGVAKERGITIGDAVRELVKSCYNS